LASEGSLLPLGSLCNYDGTRTRGKNSFGDFARIDRRAFNAAVEEFDVFNEPSMHVQQDEREYLVIKGRKMSRVRSVRLRRIEEQWVEAPSFYRYAA
jgi:hypothetical protein